MLEVYKPCNDRKQQLSCLCLWWEALFFLKCSIAQTAPLTCIVVTLVLRSSQWSEPTSGQFKACSDILFWARSRTSSSSLESRSKLLETESLAEVQFVIDSCRFVSQSNYLNNTDKDCDWFKIKFGLKIYPNAWGNYWILYHKTNKEASTVLCSVVKHLGSARVPKK